MKVCSDLDPTAGRVLRTVYGRTGWLPECRGATVQHFIQGGSSMLPFHTARSVI